MTPYCVFHALSQELGDELNGDLKSQGHELPEMRDGPQLDAVLFVR
jgi:hypothetical protein